MAFAPLALVSKLEQAGAMATIEQRGDSYRVIFRYCGRRFARSLKTTHKREALSALARLEDNLRRAELGLLLPPDGVDIPSFLLSDGKLDAKPSLPKISTLDALLKNYFASIPKGSLEPSTLHGMGVHCTHLKRGLGKNFLIQGLEAAHLQRYIEERSSAAGIRGREISGATIRKEIVTLRTVWNWSLHMGFVKKAFPNRGLRYPKLHEKPPFQTMAEVETRIARGGLTPAEEGDLWDCVFLTLQEINELLKKVEERALQPFIHPMIYFAAHTGARRSEIIRSQIDDIDFRSETVLIREKKRVRGKLSTRRVPLTAQLKKVLIAWLEVHPGSSTTFAHLSDGRPGPLTSHEAQHHFKRTLLTTRWERLRGWHVFRHSFCSNCAARGVDQRVINAWTGHQTEEMVKRYRHLIPNQEQEAIQSVFG
jgi:integrase